MATESSSTYGSQGAERYQKRGAGDKNSLPGCNPVTQPNPSVERLGQSVFE